MLQMKSLDSKTKQPNKKRNKVRFTLPDEEDCIDDDDKHDYSDGFE